MPETHEFGSNNGRLIGVFGIAMASLIVVAVGSDGIQRKDAGVIAVAALLAALLWCVFLRPRLRVTGSVLHLRNAFTDVEIPLVQVEYAAVTLFTTVVTADRSFRSNAVARTRREFIKNKGADPDPLNNTADLVELRINQLAEDARAKELPDGEAVIRPARLELAVLAAIAAVCVALVFV